jgi:hypothetical protein
MNICKLDPLLDLYLSVSSRSDTRRTFNDIEDFLSSDKALDDTWQDRHEHTSCKHCHHSALGDSDDVFYGVRFTSPRGNPLFGNYV